MSFDWWVMRRFSSFDVIIYNDKIFCSPKITIIFAFVNVCGVKGFNCATFAILSLDRITSEI